MYITSNIGSKHVAHIMQIAFQACYLRFRNCSVILLMKMQTEIPLLSVHNIAKFETYACPKYSGNKTISYIV